MRKLSLLIATLAIGLSGFIGLTPAPAQASVAAGTLVRGNDFSVVSYIAVDGFRYVFPNEKAFFTWYDDFDDVMWISAEELGMYQIGGNVTYRPGVRMVKIQTDPKVYAVAPGGVLRWVTTEDIAEDLYGSNWNTDIDDVPDSFFNDYTIGFPIMSASDYSPSDAMGDAETIAEDKNLTPYTLVYLTDEGIEVAGGGSDNVNIDEGETVKWLNTDSDDHNVLADDETWGSGPLPPNHWFVRRFVEQGNHGYEETETGDDGSVIVTP